MMFDIHLDLFDPQTKEFREKEAANYHWQLIALFEQSPEGRVLLSRADYGGWAGQFLDLCLNDLRRTPPEMSPSAVAGLLLDLFPAKVTASPDKTPDIVREVAAFWRFLGREFGLKQAPECEEAVYFLAKDLEREMDNPDNYGMAKAVLMKGLERGFDVGTEEGIRAWLEVYAAEMRAGGGQQVVASKQEDQATADTTGRSKD